MSEKGDKYMVSNIGHLAFWVSDMERAVDFYTGALGLREAFRIYHDDGALAGVYLYIAQDQFLELFVADREGEPPQAGMTGYAHLCLQVPEARKALEELRKKGAPIDRELKVGLSRCIQFWTHDPDGNAIELMELPPESMQALATRRFAEATEKQ